MTTTYNALIPSGSVNGKLIKISATSTPGTIIHTAVSGTTNLDEVWLWVTNNHTATVGLTVEWGGNSSPDDLIQQSIPSKTGLYLLVPGIRVNNGIAIRAFATVANVVNILSNVNRITP